MRKLQKILGNNSHRKKILLVSNSTWNIYNFRLNIIEKLQEEGFDVVVAAPIDNYIFYKNSYPAVRHIAINNLERNGKKFWKDFFLLFELISIIRHERPNLVLTYTVKPNIFGAIAATLTFTKSVATVTGLGYSFIHNGFIPRISRLLYRLTARMNQLMIFENTDDRKLFIQNNFISKIKSVSIKGCGVNVHYYSPNGKSPDNRNGNITFTFLGRLVYDKGIREFVNAAKLVKEDYPKSQFWIVGAVDCENPSSVKKVDFENWTEENYLKCWGHTDEVKDILSRSDCIVLPSYREAIPRSLTEAMSMGKPVITTEAAGCREAVEQGINGFLVPIKNSAKLANAIKDIINMPVEERKSMGERGREKALREFDDKIIADVVFQHIRKFVSA